MTTYASDTFNRANGGIGTSDGPGSLVWTSNNHGSGAGTFSIVSTSKAQMTASSPSTENTCTLATGQSDCVIYTVDYDAAATGISYCVRFTDINNWNLPYIGGMYKIVGGSYTLLTPNSGYSSTPTSGLHTFAVGMSGATITHYIDGVSVAQYTETNQQTATNHGLRATAASGLSDATVWDNFFVTDTVPPPPSGTTVGRRPVFRRV